MRSRHPAFPVGLYGMLLFALCWLTLPKVFAPLEALLLGVTCQVPRWLGSWLGTPAHAAPTSLVTDRLASTRRLRERLLAHDIEEPAGLRQAGLEPVPCVIVATERRRGGGGGPCELRLDRTYAELAGCRSLVTKGDVLVGTLQVPGVGLAATDTPDDLARVVLTNHPAAPPLFAAIELAAGGPLHVVVRAAATVDPAPLRVDLWEDPYRGVHLDQVGAVVRTASLPRGDGGVPAGLRLGTTRLWGYRAAGQVPPVTLGVFLAPVLEVEAMSHAVVWREPKSLAVWPAPTSLATRGVRQVPAELRALPGQGGGRHLLAMGSTVPDGAAVLQDGAMVGIARGLAFGIGLVTTFAASRRSWNLVLLPDDENAPPHEFMARVVGQYEGGLWLERPASNLHGPSPLPAGYLFTGNHGEHCPPGLWIGRATPVPEAPRMLQVATTALASSAVVEVLVGGAR